MCAKRVAALHRLRRSRIAVHSGKKVDIQPSAKTYNEILQHRQRGEPFVGHDDRPLEAALTQMIPDELARARTELNVGRKRKA